MNVSYLIQNEKKVHMDVKGGCFYNWNNICIYCHLQNHYGQCK